MIQIILRQCQYRDLDNIYILAQSLAHYFPRPEQSVIPIYELLLNAIEHGNLGIGFELKSELVRTGSWHQEVLRRMALPENSTKEVNITLQHDAQGCELRIADAGAGFAWREFMQREMTDRRPNGRGIWVALHADFDRMEYNPRGNEVTCAAYYHGLSRATTTLALSQKAGLPSN